MGHTMKTTIVRAVAALSLAAAALLTPTTANAYTDPAVVLVTPSVPVAGGVATFTTASAAFQGDEEVLVSVTGAAANSVTLASVAVETNTSLRSRAAGGFLNTPVRFPANAKGQYTFTFTGVESKVVLHAGVTVGEPTAVVGAPTAPANGGLAVTGFDAGSTTGLWLTGGALVTAGAAVAIGAIARRRRSSKA